MFETKPMMSSYRARVMHTASAFAIALMAITFAASTVEAQLGAGGLQRSDANRDEMRIAGWWGGPVRDIAVEGDTAVCAIGTRVVVLDVSDKNNPQRTDEIDLGFVVRDVELYDGYAYAITTHTVLDGNTCQFSIIDAQNPGSAKIVYFSPPRGLGGGWGNNEGIQYEFIELFGSYALLYNNADYIDVYSIAVPGAATFIQQSTWSETLNPTDFKISGNYLYILDDETGGAGAINIYDLDANPLHPPLVASVPVNGDLKKLAVEDGYLAVLDADADSVLVFDVSDPANPVQTGAATGFTSRLSDVSIANGYLCIADHTTVGWTGGQPRWNLTEGLSIFDIWSNPGVPELVSTFKTHGATRGVVSVGTTVYTFDDGEGLVLIDIKDPTDPQRLGTYYSPATLRQMAKVGNLLYVTDEWNGFSILDVSTPAHPAVAGVYQSPEWGYADHFGIAVRDNWAIFAAGYGGVHVVDVSDPANPSRMFDHDFGTEQFTGAVEIDGNIVRVGWRNDFTNFSFENPPNLAFVANVGGAHGAMAIATTDEGITHVARRRHTVVNNADPTIPQVLSNQLDPQSLDLVHNGDYIYTNDRRSASIGGGFYIRDISDPATPTTVWYFPVNDPKAVTRAGSKVFFSARSAPNPEFPEPGLFQFDASNPESPVFLNYLRVEGIQNMNELGFGRDGCLDLLAEPGIVYATTVEGLAIIQVGGPQRPKAATSIRDR